MRVYPCGNTVEIAIRNKELLCQKFQFHRILIEN